jgi:hypothetical protein
MPTATVPMIENAICHASDGKGASQQKRSSHCRIDVADRGKG